MDFSSLHGMLAISGLSMAIGCYLAFTNGPHLDRRDWGVLILILSMACLLANTITEKTSYSPIQKPDLIEKGLVITVIEQLDNTFFIKTPKGQLFLIRPDKKDKKIPVIGNKVIFTGDSYEVVSGK